MRPLAAMALLAAALAAPVQAAPPYYSPNGPRADQGPRGGLTLDEAVARVRAETGGRVLSATTDRDDGRAVHRIKILTPDQRVRVIRVGE